MKVKTILISIMVLALIGCGSRESDSGYVYTQVTLSGSINGGSGGSGGLSTFNLEDNPNEYMVVIQNQVSNRI